MRRFLVDPQQIVEDKATLAGRQAHHLHRVLRLKAGDAVVLTDGSGHAHEATIDTISPDGVSLTITRTQTLKNESPLKITMAQALLKGPRMDLLIRQFTELGIARWLPFQATRSVAKAPPHKMADRAKRWETIARESIKQCRRQVAPEVWAPVSFEALLTEAAEHELRLVFWEEATRPLDRQIEHFKGAIPETVIVVIGPEGGLTHAEVEALGTRGFITASLGPRMLRAETAAVAACALVQHLLGDM